MNIPFFPIVEAPGCKGWTTLCNFSPNNWEVRGSSDKYVNVTWAAEGEWRSDNIGRLASGEMRTVSREELSGRVPSDRLPLLSLTTSLLPPKSDKLPKLDAQGTAVPAWRATIGLSSANASTSYQGEIDPFPPNGSMLTFCPFLQFGPGIRNYLLFVNIEALPASRPSRIEVYDAASVSLKGSFEAASNNVTTVPLDDMGLGPEDLPLLICRTMAGIPLYCSMTSDGSFLSLEHTHPPASYAIHGNRWGVQKVLKDRWFARAAQQ